MYGRLYAEIPIVSGSVSDSEALPAHNHSRAAMSLTTVFPALMFIHPFRADASSSGGV